jgi:hypothetical protein
MHGQNQDSEEDCLLESWSVRERVTCGCSYIYWKDSTESRREKRSEMERESRRGKVYKRVVNGV